MYVLPQLQPLALTALIAWSNSCPEAEDALIIFDCDEQWLATIARHIVRNKNVNRFILG